jgi:hypothetical protein
MVFTVAAGFEKLKSNLEITGLQEATISTRQQAVRRAVAADMLLDLGERVAALALRHRLPTFSSIPEFTNAGALVGYGPAGNSPGPPQCIRSPERYPYWD